MGYCTIRSPIEGLIGKRLVAPGNLVGNGDATLLDTVSSVDPMRVNVHVSASRSTSLSVTNRKEAGEGAALELILAERVSAKGKVVIVDRAVDPKTGTLIVAEFPNPEGQLRRTVRPRACSLEWPGRDPDPEAGGPGDPGHEERAGGRCRQHGGAAHHPAGGNGRRPAHRPRRPQGRGAGDRGRDPEGPPGDRKVNPSVATAGTLDGSGRTRRPRQSRRGRSPRRRRGSSPWATSSSGGRSSPSSSRS